MSDKAEAESNAEPRCLFARAQDGTPVCGKHRKPLLENVGTRTVLGSNPPGLGHFSAWVCPVSQEPVFDAGFPP